MKTKSFSKIFWPIVLIGSLFSTLILSHSSNVENPLKHQLNLTKKTNKPQENKLINNRDCQNFQLGHDFSGVIIKDKYDSDHLYLWGNNQNHQVSPSQDASEPSPVEKIFPENKIKHLALGFKDNAGAITTDQDGKDHLYMWGYDDYGETGRGKFGLINNYQKIRFREKTISDLAIGYNHSAVITKDQKGKSHLYLMGSNAYGQLGRKSYVDNFLPKKLAFFEDEIKTLSLGYQNSGVVTSDQKGHDHLYLWGSNFYGQLGDGTTLEKRVPTKVTLPESKIQKLDLSHSHASVVTTDQDGKDHLYMWGDNRYGQLGNGNTVNQYKPTKVALPESKIKHVSLGYYHSSVVTTDQDGKDHLYLWGQNYYGELGDGSTKDKLVPKKLVLPETTIDKVDLGYHYSGIITINKDGQNSLYLWGNNRYGQLGNGQTAHQAKAIEQSLPGVSLNQVSLGYNHSSAITTDQDGENHLYLWGDNRYGQLGEIKTNNQYLPTKVALQEKKIKQVSTGHSHSSVVITDQNNKNRLFIWGDNRYGQLGERSQSNQNQLKEILLKENIIKQVSLGYNHSSAITTDQDGQDYFYIWGDNSYGQLGTGDKISRPTKTTLPEKILKQVSLGNTHSSVITTDQDGKDHLYMWGDNRYGQLGNGDNVNQYKPKEVFFAESKIKKVSLGDNHSSVITTDKNGIDYLYLWGNNDYGQLGTGTKVNHYHPSKVALPEKILKQVNLGNGHSSVITTDQDGKDHLYMWGYNNYGQLGNGKTANQYQPVEIILKDKQISQVNLGHFHSSVITTDLDGKDHLYMWGHNYYGELGLKPHNSINTPVKISDSNKEIQFKSVKINRLSFDDNQVKIYLSVDFINANLITGNFVKSRHIKIEVDEKFQVLWDWFDIKKNSLIGYVSINKLSSGVSYSDLSFKLLNQKSQSVYQVKVPFFITLNQ